MDPRRPTTRSPELWLERAPEFSRAMVETLRELIANWAPDLTEAVKWQMLCFSGRKLVLGLSACKAFAGMSFMRGAELPGAEVAFPAEQAENLALRTLRFTNLEQVNRGQLRRLVQAAVELDLEGPRPSAPKAPRTPLPLPPELAAALRRNRRAAAYFEALAPTYRREYIVWITTAKRYETRVRRLAETVAALAAGRKWLQRKG